VKTGWFEREVGGIFYTFHELFVTARLRRPAPFFACAMLVIAAGVVLLVIFDLLALAYGKVTTAPLGQTPRSIAGVAIFGGLYVWDRFASPERIALFESLDSSAPADKRVRRRLKAVAVVGVLVALCLVLFRE
jgi:hypothetical protein